MILLLLHRAFLYLDDSLHLFDLASIFWWLLLLLLDSRRLCPICRLELFFDAKHVLDFGMGSCCSQEELRRLVVGVFDFMLVARLQLLASGQVVRQLLLFLFLIAIDHLARSRHLLLQDELANFMLSAATTRRSLL